MKTKFWNAVFAAMIICVTFGLSSANAASCTVTIKFSGTCTLYYGYGDATNMVSVPGSIKLSGSSDKWDEPTHFNCQPSPGQKVTVTTGGWVMVKDGPAHPLPQIDTGAVSMPSDVYGGLASNGAAITCAAMLPPGVSKK